MSPYVRLKSESCCDGVSCNYGFTGNILNAVFTFLLPCAICPLQKYRIILQLKIFHQSLSVTFSLCGTVEDILTPPKSEGENTSLPQQMVQGVRRRGRGGWHNDE